MDKWLRAGDSPLTLHGEFATTLTCFPDGEPADMAHTEQLFTPPTPQWTIKTREEFGQFRQTLMRHLKHSIIPTAFEDLDAQLRTVEQEEHPEYFVRRKELTLGSGALTHRGTFFGKPKGARKP